MSDDFSIDISDIPMPDLSRLTDIMDSFSYNVAYKLAFAGVGQGGSRIAETFAGLGYNRVCAINTTDKDLIHINLPSASKLVLPSEDTAGRDGAGKNPAIAAAAVNDKTEEIYDLLRRSWGDRYDWSFVCFGAGGGTGAGAYKKVAEVAKKVMSDLKLPQRLGAIVALPKNDEGGKAASNAVDTSKELLSLGFSPIIIIDNEKIKDIYPRVPVNKFWQTANKSIATLLHLFNRIAAQSSQYTTFDTADLTTIMASGVVAFGATAITKTESQADISHAIRMQLSKGKQAGCIFVASDETLGKLPQDFLDHGFDMLTRLLGPDSTVHRGIYSGSTPTLNAYTMIGGLEFPHGRMAELVKLAK